MRILDDLHGYSLVAIDLSSDRGTVRLNVPHAFFDSLGGNVTKVAVIRDTTQVLSTELTWEPTMLGIRFVVYDDQAPAGVNGIPAGYAHVLDTSTLREPPH